MNTHNHSQFGLIRLFGAAFAALSLLGASNVSAAPHAKNLLRTKTNNARPVAPGTRLIATGTINPDTSSIKAISTDNRFTWVHLTPATLIVQGSRHVTPGSIGEGDKLICQGSWVDDAWGPIYQATRVEVIGTVGVATLQAKVAAACQRIAQDGSGSAGSAGDEQADTSVSASPQFGALKSYSAEYDSKYAAEETTRQALWDQVKKAESLGYDPAFERDFDNARQDFNAALGQLDSISPVPSSMSETNDSIQKGCSAYRKWADLLRQDYRQIATGHDNDYMTRDRVEKTDEATKLFDEASAEFKHGVDETVR